MGKIQFCRICRTEKNLKFTAKQLREFNKNQLSLAKTQDGSNTDRASQKLLRSTPVLGNICKDCDDRVQIFHRLDDAQQCSDSDIEIDVVNANCAPLPSVTSNLPNLNTGIDRPDTPVIVDDDDMLYNLFMQKVDQQRHQRHLPAPALIQLPQLTTPQTQQFISHFNPLITPPQSNVGSEGDDAKIIEVLTSRESTPLSIAESVTPIPTIAPQIVPENVDQKGHRIVAVIDLDEENDDTTTKEIIKTNNDSFVNNEPQYNIGDDTDPTKKLLNFIVASATYTTEHLNNNHKESFNLSNDNENQKKPGAVVSTPDDEDEIVFRRVQSKQDVSPIKKKTRKSYAEKDMRLVASLSLLSSDSESEDTACNNIQKQISISPKRFNCQQCELNFPDQESLSVHGQNHKGIKCPVCQMGYPQEHHLIHHMRYKHRTFCGHDLTEKPRAAQDSAMTIRLRFMQRKTFYECQLCGRIDEIFKDHKEHIISKHPIESKKLKDPIMKELKCPLCKCKCGMQYLTLCRHLLTNHECDQYKTHLREILHVSAFGWNGSRQQEVAKTARIYQFTKRKTFFFQCKKCKKVVAGYLNHLKHNASHCTGPKNMVPKSLSSREKLDEKSPKEIISKSKNKISKLAQVLNSTKTLNKIKKKILQKDLKSLKKSKSTTVKNPQILKKTLKSNNHKTNKSKVNTTKTKEKKEKKEIFKKPKNITKDKNNKPNKENNKYQKSIKASQTAGDKSNAANKRKRSKDESVIKPKVKKVKVKPIPIKLINLQTFKCKFCSKRIKGFRLYNLHLLNKHKDNEYQNCPKCHKTYLDPIMLQKHIKNCKNVFQSLTKQRRKYIKNLPPDVNCSTEDNTLNKRYCLDVVDCTEESSLKINETKVPECCERRESLKKDILLPALENNEENAESAKPPMWLNDLLKLNKNKNTINNNNKNNDDKDINSLPNTANMFLASPKTSQSVIDGIVPCYFCLHLFSSSLALQQHILEQHSQNKSEILIKFKPPSKV